MIRKESRRTASFFLSSFLLALGVTLGCWACDAASKGAPSATTPGDAPAPDSKLAEKPAQTPTGKANGTTASLALEQYFQLMTQRMKDPTQGETMTTLYAGPLQGFVKEVDARHGLSLDATINTALAAIREGKDVRVNAQTAEKNAQRAFLLAWLENLAVLSQNPSDVMAKDRLADFLGIATHLAERRGTWAKKGLEYADQVKAIDKTLTTATDAEAVAKAAQDMMTLTYKLLLYSVQYELIGLKNARGLKPEEAAEKRVEAAVYYDTLYDEHARRRVDSAKAVKAELAKVPDEMDLDLLRTLLSKDFMAESAEIPLAELGW